MAAIKIIFSLFITSLLFSHSNITWGSEDLYKTQISAYQKISNVIPTSKELSSLLLTSAPIAGYNCVAASEYIMSRWALSQLTAKEMAVSELIAHSQGVSTVLGVSMFASVEDLIAEERGRYDLLLSKGLKIDAQRHAENIGKIYRSANIIGLLVGLPIAASMRAIKPIMVSGGYNVVLYSLLDDYFRVFALCVPFRNLSFLNCDFSIATGHTTQALMISSISFLTCGFNYLFILGPDPFRFSNVFEGIAFASMFDAFICLGTYLTIYKNDPRFSKYKIFSSHFSADYISEIIKKSFPILGKNLLSVLIPLIIAQFIIPDQEEVLALYCLSEQIFYPSKLILDGIGRATNLKMKQSTDEAQRIRYGVSGIIQSLFLSGSVALSVYFLPEMTASIFVNESSATKIMLLNGFKTIASIKTLDYFITSLNEANVWALRGLGEYNSPVLSGIISSWGVALPASYILVSTASVLTV